MLLGTTLQLLLERNTTAALGEEHYSYSWGGPIQLLLGRKLQLFLADLQIIHAFLAAGVNALKLSVQKCQKLSKIGPKLTKIGPKMSKIIQI